MSTRGSYQDLFQLFKNHEEELVEALSNTDLLCLSNNLLENVVITKEINEKFLSLDHDQIKSRAKARYLFNHILQGIKSGIANYSNIMKTLTSINGHTRQVILMIDENLARQTGAEELPNCSSMEFDVQLEVRDLSKLAELLVKCAHKWELICIALNLPNDVLEDCKDGSCNKVRLYKVLTKWLTGAYPHAESTTLESLKMVLAGDMVGERKLAYELEKKFMEPRTVISASLSLPNLSCSNLPFQILYQSGNTKVADHKSALLEVQVSSDELVSYQWMKNGLPLSDSSDFSGTSTEILFLNRASMGMEGNYSCLISCGSEQQTSSPATLSIVYPPDKQCLLDLYSTWSEIPETPWPFVNAGFIDPTLIKIKTLHSRDHSLFLQGKLDQVLEGMEKVEYCSVFHEYERGTLFLVEGRPGSGKTTLAHRLVKDWALGAVLKNVDCLLHVSLRKKSIEMFEPFNGMQSEMFQSKLVQSRGDRVCFVLDGYDEYISSRKEESIIDQLIQKTYLPLSMVVITSRPVATVDLRQKANMTVEILGFTKNQFDKYVSSYPFECPSKHNMQEFLKAFSDVMNICYLPINASIFCFLYSQQLDKLPKTETQVYKRFTEAIILRELKLKNLLVQSMEDLTTEEKECLSQVCKLAFTMTSINSQIVHKLPPTLVSLYETPFSGLLTNNQHGVENVFTFLHLTLQEYLAACHLASLSENEQTRLIKLHSGEPHMLTTFKFYCGLVSFDNKMYQFDEITKSFKPDCLYMVHCAFESQQHDVCYRVMWLLKQRVYLSHGTYTPADFIALGYVIATAPEMVLGFWNSPCILYEDSVGELWKNRAIFDQDSPLPPNCTELLTDIAACKDDMVFSRVSYNLRPQYLYSRYKLNEFYSYFWNNLVNSKNVILISKCLSNVTWPDSVNNNFASDIMAPLANALKCCTKLHILRFFRCTDQDAKIIADVAKFNKRHLHTFAITSGHITSSSVSVLFKELKSCRNMKELDLSFCRFRFDSIAALAKGITHCVGLEVLKLRNCGINAGGATALCSGIRTLTLHELDISGNCIGNKGTVALASECLKSLRVLDISSNQVFSEGLIHFTKEMKKGRSKLVSLKLANNSIDVIGIRALAEVLMSCTDLQSLLVSSNNIDSDGMAALASGLRFNSTLQTLGLNNNKICFVGILSLVDSLVYLECLKTLDLSGNNVDSDGISALVTGLEVLKNLEVLHLSQNHIDSRGARDLARSLKYTPLLSKLNLSFNRIDTGGAATVNKALQGGKIRYLNYCHNVIGSGCDDSVVALIRRSHLELLDLSYNNIGPLSVKRLLDFQKSGDSSLKLNLISNGAPEVVKETPIESQMKWNLLL